MNYVNIKDIESIKDLYKLWNIEFGTIFPISSLLFQRNCENLCLDCSYLALDNNEIVGFVLGKIQTNDYYYIDAYKGIGWINLIYVIPTMRKKGVGSSLLKLCIDSLKSKNCRLIHLGRDYHNYFPGLPMDMKSYLEWFIKRGFVCSRNTYDLITRNDYQKLKIINSDFEFKIANLDDKDNLIAFINQIWPGRWTQEAIEYFNNCGKGNEYLICLNSNKEICGFCKVNNPDTPISQISNNMTWRNRFDALGGIGPLGIHPDYRGRHLGYDIVAYAVNYLKAYPVSDIIIDWTGLLEFYRPLGFEVWKSYFYLHYDI